RTLQLADIEGLERLAETLNDDAKRAQIALRRAKYGYALSDYPAAITAAQKTVVCAQALGLTALEIEGRLCLGNIYARQTNVDAARAEFEQTLALARTINAQSLEADGVIGLGRVAMYHGDFELAWTNLEHALTVVRNLGDRTREADLLSDLGLIA